MIGTFAIPKQKVVIIFNLSNNLHHILPGEIQVNNQSKRDESLQLKVYKMHMQMNVNEWE